jgi:hypothetical protein
LTAAAPNIPSAFFHDAAVPYETWKPPLGDGEARAPFSTIDDELLVNADIEPDCDGDGLGDETQDALADCAPPDTTITKGPKDRTKKRKATFEFSGTDARAVAGFECSLDGASFTSCVSPLTLKVKKGKHTFSVRAVDAAGNPDGSPATDDWKVKKKRKKK